MGENLRAWNNDLRRGKFTDDIPPVHSTFPALFSFFDFFSVFFQIFIFIKLKPLDINFVIFHSKIFSTKHKNCFLLIFIYFEVPTDKVRLMWTLSRLFFPYMSNLCFSQNGFYYNFYSFAFIIVFTHTKKINLFAKRNFRYH